MSDRIPCINPMCRRTASRAKFGNCEIICGKCLRAAKPETREAWRRMKRRSKKINRLLLSKKISDAKYVRIVLLWNRRHDALWQKLGLESANAMVGI